MPILHKDRGDFTDNYHSCLLCSVFVADGSVGDVAECTGKQQSCSYKSALLWSSTNTALCVHKALNNQCNFQGGRRKFEKWDKNCLKTKVFTSNDMRSLASAGQRLQIHHQPGHLTPAFTSESVSPPPALRFGLLRASDDAARRALWHVPLSACFQRETWAVQGGGFLLCFVFMYLLLLHTHTLMP